MTGWWTIADRPPEAPGCFVIPSYALVDRTTPTLPTRAEIELAARWLRKRASRVTASAGGVRAGHVAGPEDEAAREHLGRAEGRPPQRGPPGRPSLAAVS